MKLLKIGISGVRGIIGETMTPELVTDFACAFGTYLNSQRVLLGRDTRVSGPMLHAAATAALLSTGCDVLDLGLCPTPILQFLVKKLRAGGGVSISAGHNDASWNALTFINREGTYLNEYEGEEVLDIYHLGKFKKVPVGRLGKVWPQRDYHQDYFKNLIKFLDVEAIARAKFKVVIDACNGAGAGVIDLFCKHLHSELIPVNNQPTGYFPHDPEPRPRNAAEVSSIMGIVKADAGFLLSSDVSRLSLVAENGETLSEEYTFPLIANYYLSKNPGPVITNFSTSRMVEDVARTHGCPVVKTKVGQSYAIQTLLVEQGVIAGEGSGSVAIRDFHPAYDSFLAMGLILEMMAMEKKKISEAVKLLPKYHIVKEKIYCPPSKVHTLVSEVRRHFGQDEINTFDGIRIDREDGWVHIRASATEPMIRIIAENISSEKAQEEVEKVSNFITQLV